MHTILTKVVPDNLKACLWFVDIATTMGPRGQAGVNPYRGCAEIVWKSCNLSGVAMQSPQPPDGNRNGTCAASVQRLRGDGAVR